MKAEFKDVEPVFEFIQKVGTSKVYGIIEVDMISSGPALSGRVVVYKDRLDLFAAELFAAGQPDLYRSFMEAFPEASPQTYLGA